jgi:hypothetical protein
MREIIRPGPGIPAWPSRNSIIQPSWGQHMPAWGGFPARPDSPNPAQPGRAGGAGLLEGAAGQAVQVGHRPKAQPGRRGSKPSQGRRGRPSRDAHTGLAGEHIRRPSRLAGRRPTRGARPGERPAGVDAAQEEEIPAWAG